MNEIQFGLQTEAQEQAVEAAIKENRECGCTTKEHAEAWDIVRSRIDCLCTAMQEHRGIEQIERISLLIDSGLNTAECPLQHKELVDAVLALIRECWQNRHTQDALRLGLTWLETVCEDAKKIQGGNDDT